MPFGVLADVVGGERAQRCDRASRVAQVLQEPIHETSGITPSPILGPCSDVRHDHQAIAFGVVGNTDDVAVSAEFEAAISGVFHDDKERFGRRHTGALGSFDRSRLIRRFNRVRFHGAETVVQTTLFPVYSPWVIAEKRRVDKAEPMLKDKTP